MSLDVAAIATKVAVGLLGALAGKFGDYIGCKAIAKLFKENVPSYFAEVYKEIEKIMDQKLEENTIRIMDSKINGLVVWICFTYMLRKESEAHKGELHDLLEPKVSELAINVIPVLQAKDYAESALPVFIIGASLHLALLQELALVDPHAKDDPHSSSYITSIKQYADKYAKHADEVFKNLVRKRKSHITPVSKGEPFMGTYRSEGGFMTYVSTWALVWEDTLDNRQFPTIEKDGRWIVERVENERSAYIDDIVSNLNIELNGPRDAVNVWRAVMEHPLPGRQMPASIPFDLSHLEGKHDDKKMKTKTERNISDKLKACACFILIRLARIRN